MSVLDISKTLMYKFQYDYIKPKYGDGAKLYYTDTDSFVINIKLKIFSKIFPMTLKDGLTHLTMMKMIKDRFQQVRIKEQQVFLKMNQEERLLQKLLCLDQKHGVFNG